MLCKKLELLSEQINATQKLQKQKDEKELLLNKQREKANDLKTVIVKLQEKNKGILDSIVQLKEEFNSKKIETELIEKTIESAFSSFGLIIPAVQDTDRFIKLLESKISLFNVKNKELVEVNNVISQLYLELKNNKTLKEEKSIEKEKQLAELIKLNEWQLQLSADRQSILPREIATEVKREEMHQATAKAKQEYDQVTNKLNGLKTQQATLIKEQDNNNMERVDFQNRLNTIILTFTEAIQQTIFASRQELEQALLSLDEKTKYINIRKQLDDKTLSLKTLETKLKDDFSNQVKEKTFDLTFDKASEKHDELESSKEQLLKRTGEIKKQFELDDQIKSRNLGVIEQINAQEKVLKKWLDLMALLGGSKHAFNTYVQRLTLLNLINLANIHLFKLNRRYSLKMNETYKNGEELNFMLVDHYQTDEARLVDTSSGGEKFLISLALALGLSDLASKNVIIGSLFIDEGFGTLDNNTLETVISTLETLHAQGKIIGIISHVENLKERIPTQIQVLKKSNGVSELIIV